MTIVKLSPKHPDHQQIKQIAAQLASGKLVAFPTETVYGIGACVGNPAAVERLHTLKERSQDKPFAYHIGHLGAMDRLDIVQSKVFQYFVDRFFPGPVTLIALNQNGQKIGIRFPKNLIAADLINQSGDLVFASSANRAGQKSPVTVDDVLNAFPSEIDVVIDGGRTEFALDSTVVDTTTMPPTVLRPGAMLAEVEDAIQKVKENRFTRKRILIVCTGNTCRSPLAEGWLKAELKHQHFSDQIKILSCGIFARDGSGISMESALALRNDGIDVGDFKTTACRREEVLKADLILAMEEQHKKFIEEICPEARGKIILLDIDDPIGLSLEHYEKCYQSIKEKIKKHWAEIIK